jgi:hypothetical protein
MMRISIEDFKQAVKAHADPEQAATLSREQVAQLSYSERATWAAAVRTHKREAEKAAMVTERAYKCQYCRDTQWLGVLPEWVGFECIEVLSQEQIAWCDTNDRWHTVRVACDCHRGQLYGNDTDPKGFQPIKIKRFGELFGLPITEHDLGAWMLQYRRQVKEQHAAEDFARDEKRREDLARAEKQRKEQEKAA